MHIGIGVCGTIRGNQKLRAVKEGRFRRHQLDLARPLSQTGNRLADTRRRVLCLAALELRHS